MQHILSPVWIGTPIRPLPTLPCCFLHGSLWGARVEDMLGLERGSCAKQFWLVILLTFHGSQDRLPSEI